MRESKKKTRKQRPNKQKQNVISSEKYNILNEGEKKTR